MPVGPLSFPPRFTPPGRGRPSGPSSLQPTLPDRIAERFRPGWARAGTARKVGAGVLAVLATVLALRGDPDTERVPVVVAARDLSPGRALTADDLTLSERDASGLAAGSLTDLANAVGHTLAGPVPAGETLVDARLVGPRLASAATGVQDARVVPIRLADAGVGELLREGDLVDVVTVAGATDAAVPDAHVLARGAIVVLAQRADSAGDRNERVILVALEPDQATAVAAASLVSALTVTLH
ncbi:SAF domain-containing protein [Rhodococcus sp. 105337]|uniref:SAF domain-containing protein n=1 Tax=Rhodococcus sp. 105337 TaxID=2725310 RepID=UPI00146CF192|nr:SAF domain-containing protein [Rhodococcus sp. 105337]NME80107.1 flagellar biosynthesis protein FlgA [Rhodococcus sp. 105337]